MASLKRSRSRKYRRKRTTEFDTTPWDVFLKIMVPLAILAASLLFAWVILR